jgi:RNA polymerase sigma factor (sigma-70 family)
MTNVTDSELTARALEGRRDAFAQIVFRYQALVCSLAYSATGSLSQSEDLAQETFIAAWKGLRTLRDPEKLRSWLCGIARNIIAGAVRSGKQEPANAAAPIEAVVDLPSPDSLPVDRAISHEEESILWRSLEHIPILYREPLILFYREGQSIEIVARELELSEEAVKQRLSRGRKLLKMEVESFIEAALRQSTPGREFTSAVVAGLPIMSLPFGVLGTAASKGVAAAKTGSLMSILAGMLAPALGALGGIFSMVGTVKSARSAQERSLWIKSSVIIVAILAVALAAEHRFRSSERIFGAIFVVQFVAIIAIAVTTSIRAAGIRRRISGETVSPLASVCSDLPFGEPATKGYKWRVYSSLLGIIFCSPFAMMTAPAAKAHDSIAIYAILSVLAVTFLVARRIFFRKPEQTIGMMCAIEIAYFPLLMIVMYFRWEKWTGESPWQLHSYALIPIVVGFLLFLFFPIVWLVKRSKS